MNNEKALQEIEKAILDHSGVLNLNNEGFTEGITELPKEIKELTDLVTLELGFNDLTSLPPEIGNLKRLKHLLVSRNRIVELPAEIGELSNLEVLDIKSNRLKNLPLEIKNLKKLHYLDLRGNNLGLPPEIENKIRAPELVLSYYFSSLTHRKKPINQIKILFVGQGSVGKTSLIQQILHGTFSQSQTKTEGISINQWSVDSKDQQPSTDNHQPVKLSIWDFGGQEIMHATHQFFLTKRSLYVLVLDSRLTQEENRVEYWLKIIQSFGGESPVLLVGNKTDQHPLDIDRTGLGKKYPNIVGILETSAATGTGIEAFKAEIAKQVDTLPHVRDLLPETWFTVKSKLEELGREQNFITQDEYLNLCEANDVADETSQHTLISFLHDLGAILYFQDDPRLESLGILSPQWVTNGVYRILNSKDLFKNKGVLTIPLLNSILNFPEYPKSKHLFIVDVMKRFELCYDIETDKMFLVPDLLPKDEPEGIDINSVAAFQYQYPVLPPKILTRLIVRMHQHIENNLVWRTGVILKMGENRALVKANLDEKNVSIFVEGLEHKRRDVLSAIRYQLDEIHATIKGLEVQKRVPIPEAPNAEPLDYDYLLQLERDGFDELPVKDGNRLVKVDVRKLLSGVVSENERKLSAGNITNIYVGGDIKGGNIISGDDNQANVKMPAEKKPRKKKS